MNTDIFGLPIAIAFLAATAVPIFLFLQGGLPRYKNYALGFFIGGWIVIMGLSVLSAVMTCECASETP